MSSGDSEIETVSVEKVGTSAEIPITIRLVGTAMLGGLVATGAMLPVLAGIPIALDLFRTEPLLRFAGFLAFFGLEPSPELGVVLFGFGGAVVLPLQFLVVGAFLPPKAPRYMRGVSFALIYWVGFLLVFWPGGGPLTIGLFVVVSAIAHVVYGFGLGWLIDRWAEIPQHAV